MKEQKKTIKKVTKKTSSMTGKNKKVEPRKEFEKFIRGKIDMISKQMLFDFVKFNIIFPEGKNVHKRNHQVGVFSIRFSRQYRTASIEIMDQAFEMYERGQIVELVDGLVHELTHIHTIPLSLKGEDRYATLSELRELSEELTEIMAEYIRGILRNTVEDLYKK